MVAKNSTHPVTLAGVLEVDLTNYHQNVEIVVDGASPVWVTTDPAFTPSTGSPATPNPAANSDDTEWIGAGSSNVIVNHGPQPEQGISNVNQGTRVWVYCASAGVQLHVHGR